MLTNIRSYFIRFKKFQTPLERYIFPVVLLLYPLIGVNQGVDISDTMYSLSNYQFIDGLHPMWLFSTFLSNVFGSAIMSFPGANTMLGFNIYCSFITSVIALICYYSLQHFMPGWMIFIAELIAESICFTPRAILYNYFTYFFFSLATIFLLGGMFQWRRQNLYLFLAGVFLGLNVMVRFPNIVETAMILVLWFHSFIIKEQISEVVKKTLNCIGGFLAGFGFIFLCISLKYGFMAYPDGIMSLFGMTEGAKDYTGSGMIALIVEAYMTTLKHMVILIPCVFAGIVMFLILPQKYVAVKKFLYVGGILVLVRYFFAIGVLTRNYYYYDSMFQFAMMFVIVGIVLCIIGTLGILNGNKEEQTISFAVLMLILITPIGSNNYTFPILNNLFVIAPVIFWLFRRMMQRAGERDYNFAWESMITMVIIVLLIQGTLFHINYSFMDGADGTPRDSYVSVAKVKGMVTTGYNAETLNELGKALEDNELTGKKVILFGGIPGLAYLYDLKPAIDSSWPDLDSYATTHFDEQLMNLSVSDEPSPIIIVSKNISEHANVSAKYDILMDYIANHDYNIDFENDRFTVYESEE